MNDAVTLLPVAGGDRWRPTRAGLVNLWRYWDETFTFHHGRLLLRGPNGSGKSMALELLLPFLLDADSNPNRLTSAAKSRGGLYERVMTGTVDSGRAGFAWVELRRGEQVFTVGVRMRASTSTHKVDLDFFTASLEVGTELHLLDEHRSVLSRKGLVEALGDRGRVHSSAEEHRAAVRETLFPGFGADRYASVITALLALRKEKLSQNLDLAKLSEVLSEALPALDEHDLAVVAEGFERLDRRRSELAKLEAELVEIRALAARQRDYARVVAAGVAGQVRRAETRRDDVTKAERAAVVALEAARTDAEAVEAEVAALVERLAALDTEIDALKASDAYRDGATLDDLRDSARRAREARDRDQRVAAHRAEERARQVAAVEELAGERDRGAANLESAAGDLRRSAGPVGAEGVAGEAEAAGADEGERLVRAWVRARRQLIEEMRKALRAHESAVQQRVFTESRVAGDEAVVDERLASRRAAAAAHAGAVTAYVEAVGSWATSCTAVGSERVRAAIPHPPEDPAGVAAGVGRLAAELRAEHAVTRANLGADRVAVEDELGRLLVERDSLAEGGIVEPAPPSWRSERAGRVGAPLWRLVDVVEGVAPADVDGLEAALAASGLLDAWVAPDGSVDLPDGTADVVLGRRPVEGRSAADLLVAHDEVAAGVLASIAVGDATAGGPEVVVGTDGTFRLGPATGRGLVRPAELLGAAAQERHRLARLAEVEATIAATEARRAEIDRELSAVDAREAAALADLDAAPAGGQVTEAARQAELAEARLVEAEDRLAASRRALGDAEENVRQALRTLATLGARHQLPTTAEAIEEVVRALAALETAIGTWARRARELVGAERHLRRARADAERATDGAAEAAANVAASQRAAAEVEVKLATLESSIGAGYRELLDRIAGLDGERRHGRDRQRQLSERRPEMQRRIGKLETELAQAETARVEADGQRAAAHRRFVALKADGIAADTGLPAAAPAGDLEGVTAVLAAARALAAELEGVVADDQAVERASARVEERLHHARAALGSSVDLSRTLADEGWWLLRATAGGLRRPVREQALALAVDLEEGRAELAAEEERLFEQTLAGSVRHALADRIRLANQLVDGINRQLGAVRSAAGGVQVRLRWEVDSEQPKAVKEARALLLRDPASLSDDERASLQAFVRARVDQARAELEVNAPWEARLRETLDYRAWHRFTLQLAHRDWAGFEPATARRLQRLSTGERSVALHLPMLASIAAHYSDGDGKPAGCPRLILLDELFAGVDSVNRAQLFGTFTAWDLDAVFTSDHEWCQYASLDGIAIHHLHPAVGDEPVTSTRFTWDGRRRELDPERGVITSRSRPELAPVWAELARRFGDGDPPVAITLRDLSMSQRQAVADLLGLDRLPAPTVRLRVDRLATAFGVAGVDGVRAAVEAQMGPIVDRKAARLEARRRRDDVWAWLADQAGSLPLVAGDADRMGPWVETVRAAGVPGGDVDRHRRRLAAVLAVLATLPADGIGLASLAADVLSDPHALDRGRATASLVLDAVAVARQRARPTDAEAARLLWEEVGVVPDPLSSVVLALGLHLTADHPFGSVSAAGEPVVLTLSQLRRWPVDPLPAGGAAFVVENPSLVAAAATGGWGDPAAARGWGGPPLLCSSGRPTVAVVSLVRQLRAAGAEVFQHADFDPAGLGITGWLAQRAGTIPWRMGAADYLAAVATDRERVGLAGRLPPAPWDPDLVEAMAAHGVAVYEEELRAGLLSAISTR